MTAADRATLVLVAAILALAGLGTLVACDARGYDTQAMEVTNAGLRHVPTGALQRPSAERTGVLFPLRQCRPPRGVVCQRAPQNDHERVRRTLNAHGFGWAWRTFACIAYRESRWTPAYRIDTNGWPSRSLYQINDRYWSWVWRGRDWRNPVDATLAAIDVYKAADGFSPWGGCP